MRKIKAHLNQRKPNACMCLLLIDCILRASLAWANLIHRRQTWFRFIMDLNVDSYQLKPSLVNGTQSLARKQSQETQLSLWWQETTTFTSKASKTLLFQVMASIPKLLNREEYLKQPFKKLSKGLQRNLTLRNFQDSMAMNIEANKLKLEAERYVLNGC